jgi:hypothetical protein
MRNLTRQRCKLGRAQVQDLAPSAGAAAHAFALALGFQLLVER